MINITKDTSIREIRELGKDCRQCGHCCFHGAGFLIDEDIPRLAKFLKTTEKELKEKYLEEIEMFHTKTWKPKRIKEGKPFGPCIFHDKNDQCTVHIAKPFQCKITNCNPLAEQTIQWFYLNYFVNKDDPESIRQWASYIKHRDSVIEGGKLEDLVPEKEKLKQILNYEVMK